jgi:hypothetical protein
VPKLTGILGFGLLEIRVRTAKMDLILESWARPNSLQFSLWLSGLSKLHNVTAVTTLVIFDSKLVVGGKQTNWVMPKNR